MTCPDCKTRNANEARYCTNCGILFRKDVLHRKAPQPAVPKNSLLRLGAVVVAAAIGGGAGFVISNTPKGLEHRPTFILGGVILGAALVYVVSGLRVIFLTNQYRVKLTALNMQVNSAVNRAINQSKDAVDTSRGGKKDEAAVLNLPALQKLGEAHLLNHDIDESIKAFEQAINGGLKDPKVFNNSAVAFIRAGRMRHAMTSLESAVQAKNGSGLSEQTTANLAHYFGSLRVGSINDNLRRAENEVQELINKNGESPTYLNRLGLIQIREGNFDAAYKHFEKSLALAKDKKLQVADARNNMGVAKFHAGEFKAAALEFQQALKVDPGHARAESNLGVTMIVQGFVKSGIETLIKAATVDPRSCSVLNNLGYAYCVSGAFNDGIKTLLQAVQLDLNAFEPVYNLGKVYADHDLPEVAGRYLDRANQIDTSSWEALLAGGVVLMQQGEYDHAMELVRKAYDIAPKSAEILMTYGTCATMLKDYDSAVQYMMMAIAMEHSKREAYARLGWVHMQRHDASEAARVLGAALNMSDDDAYLSDNYGLCQLELWAKDLAGKHFKRVLQLEPNYKRVWYHMGLNAVASKNLDDAISCWDKTITYEPKYIDGHANLGVACYLADKYDKAIEQFKQVLFMHSERMQDFAHLAMATAKKGVSIRKKCKDPNDQHNPKVVEAYKLFNSAVQMFDKALEMEPENVVLHSNRGLACFFANRVEEAMMEWSNVTRIDPEYAKKRGKLQQSVFDESAVTFFPLNIAERAASYPLKTGPYLYKVDGGYDTEDWELILDEELAKVPQISREVDHVERKLRALKL